MSVSNWNLDPAHSNVLFSVKHMGISTVRGSIGGLTGTLSFDPGDPSSFKMHIQMDPKTVNTGNQQRDAHLASADFLEVETFPTITYDATQIEKQDSESFKIRGTLTIKGHSKEVELLGEGPSPETADPYGNLKLGASATASFNRTEFGVTFHHLLDTGAHLVGELIKVTIDVQFAKQA